MNGFSEKLIVPTYLQSLLYKLIKLKIFKILLFNPKVLSILGLQRTPSDYYLQLTFFIETAQSTKITNLGFQVAKPFNRILPISIDPNIHESFLKEEVRSGQDIFAYEIADARVWGSREYPSFALSTNT